MNKVLNELDIPVDKQMDKKEQIRILTQLGEDLDELLIIVKEWGSRVDKNADS